MGVITVWSDIGCPWAHVAVYRLFTARERLGLEDAVQFDHRPLPLELVNERPTPWHSLQAELPVTAGIEPEAGWVRWEKPWEWPVTTLPALEAVQAVRAEQGLVAASQLDRALRVAFFGSARCVALRHVILDVAAACPLVDGGALERALDRGTARQAVISSWRAADGAGVEGSPHVFGPDGTGRFNPGVQVRWLGPEGHGFPVVTSDDPSAYDDLLRSAATAARIPGSRARGR